MSHTASLAGEHRVRQCVSCEEVGLAGRMTRQGGSYGGCRSIVCCLRGGHIAEHARARCRPRPPPGTSASATGRRCTNAGGAGAHPNSGDSYNDAVPSLTGPQIVFLRLHVDGIMMRLYVRPIRGGTERPITRERLEA